MKETFKDTFKQLRHCSHIPNQYYGHLLTLAGIVYSNETDKEIEHDLKQLSLTYDNMQNSTLVRIKEIVHDIVFWTKSDKNNCLPDIEHLLREYRNAPIEQVNTFIANVVQLYSNNNNQNTATNESVKITVDFTRLIDKLQSLLNDLEPEPTKDFNIAKILGFITTKGIEKGYIMENDKSDE
jgi:hypothetical protein